VAVRKHAAPARAGRPRQSAESEAAKREKIVGAARHVFARTGVSKASMREIAHEAGISVGSIYRYFADADALYGAVLAQSLDELAVHVKAQVEDRAEARVGRSPSDTEADARYASVRNAANAVFTFYFARPDDAALGLYLHRGLRRAGLGHDTDAMLNAQLQTALMPLRQALKTHFALDEAGADRELFVWMASILGTVIFHHTGRAKSLGVSTEDAFAHLVARLG
jgi:AcrR family transcriptional regulator